MSTAARSTLIRLLTAAAGLVGALALLVRRRRGAQADTRVWHEATTDRPTG